MEYAGISRRRWRESQKTEWSAVSQDRLGCKYNLEKLLSRHVASFKDENRVATSQGLRARVEGIVLRDIGGCALTHGAGSRCVGSAALPSRYPRDTEERAESASWRAPTA